MGKAGAVNDANREKFKDLLLAFENNAFYKLDKVKIKIVDQCNLRCLKCNHWLPDRRNSVDQQSPLSGAEWLDTAAQLVDLGVRKVAFTGGEPTLHPDLPRIIKLLSKHGVRCSMTTNGTLLAGGLARKLLEAGISQIRFSVDGPAAKVHDRCVGVPGSFDRLMSGLQEIKDTARVLGRTVKLNFNTVVSELNIDRLDDLVKLAGEVGASEMLLMELNQDHLPGARRKKLSVSETIHHRYLRKTLPDLIAQAAAQNVTLVPMEYAVKPDGAISNLDEDDEVSLPCLYAWHEAAIFPAGDVQVCCNSRDPALFFGNVRQGRLDDILKGPQSERVRAVCRAPALRVSDCRSCPLFSERLAQANQVGLEWD